MFVNFLGVFMFMLINFPFVVGSYMFMFFFVYLLF